MEQKQIYWSPHPEVIGTGVSGKGGRHKESRQKPIIRDGTYIQGARGKGGVMRLPQWCWGLLNMLLLKTQIISRDHGGGRATDEVQMTVLERRAGCRNCSPGHCSANFHFSSKCLLYHQENPSSVMAKAYGYFPFLLKNCPPIKLTSFINVKSNHIQSSPTIPTPPFLEFFLLRLCHAQVALSLEWIWAGPFISLFYSVHIGCFCVKWCSRTLNTLAHYMKITTLLCFHKNPAQYLSCL